MKDKSRVVTYGAFGIIFVLTSFLSMGFIYNHFGQGEAFISLNAFSPAVLFQLLILLIIYFLMDGLRLYFILRALKVHIQFRYIMKLVFINIFVSNITPLATGGGFAQIYFLNKRGVSLGNATAGTTLRTVLATVFFFIATPIVLLSQEGLIGIFSSDQGKVGIPLLVIFYILLFYCCYKVIWNIRILKSILYKLGRYLYRQGFISEQRFRKVIRNSFREIELFVESMKRFFQGDSRFVIASISFTLLFLFSLFLFSVVLVRGLGYAISPFTIIGLQILITFLTYCAITPGAAGIAEGGYSLLYAQFVDQSHIALLTFSWRFFSIYIGMVIGAIVFCREIFWNTIRVNGNATKIKYKYREGKS